MAANAFIGISRTKLTCSWHDTRSATRPTSNVWHFSDPPPLGPWGLCTRERFCTKTEKLVQKSRLIQRGFVRKRQDCPRTRNRDQDIGDYCPSTSESNGCEI